jgi:hypothetical protein
MFLLFYLRLFLGGQIKAESLKTERRVNLTKGQSQKINFDDATIMGDFKSPFASLLNSQDTSFDGGFAEMRTNWRDMLMISVIHVTP